MTSSRALWTALAVLSIAVILVYGTRWLFATRKPGPDALAQAALTAGSLKERTLAAVKLIEFGKLAKMQIRQVLEQSKDPEVRVACIQGLTEQWDFPSVPLFLDLLGDPSPEVRLQASDSLRYLLAKDFPFREINGDGQEAQREAMIKTMRDGWEQFKMSGLNLTYMLEKMGKNDKDSKEWIGSLSQKLGKGSKP